MQLTDALNEKTAIAFIVGVAFGIAGMQLSEMIKMRNKSDELEDRDIFEEEQHERFSHIKQKYTNPAEAHADLIGDAGAVVDSQLPDEETIGNEFDYLGVDIITRDDYVNEKPNYTKRTATYFVKDDVLAGFDQTLDELSFAEIQETIGEALFNELCDLQVEGDDLYIRNDATQTDVNIIFERNYEYIDAVVDVENSSALEEVSGDE